MELPNENVERATKLIKQYDIDKYERRKKALYDAGKWLGKKAVNKAMNMAFEALLNRYTGGGSTPVYQSETTGNYGSLNLPLPYEDKL